MNSPVCAALMSSILPGLGQVHSGYPLEGLISFLSVAITTAGGFYMKGGGQKSISNTMFFFTGLFYGGNIYGAYNIAEKGNLEILKSRQKSLTSRYGEYSPGAYISFESVFN